MIRTLASFPNVRVFYFQNDRERITDLNNYADLEHYRPAFNRYMAECFADGTFEVFAETADVETEKMREIAQICGDGSQWTELFGAGDGS